MIPLAGTPGSSSQRLTAPISHTGDERAKTNKKNNNGERFVLSMLVP